MSSLQAKINPQAVSTPFAVALIIAKNEDFNRSIMKYLWQNGVDALLTSSLTEGQSMIIQHLPDFVFLPYDHGDYQQVASFAKKFSRLKTTHFIAYAETELPTAVARITQYQTKKSLHPPITGESFLKIIRAATNQSANWSDLRNQKIALLKNVDVKKTIDSQTIRNALSYISKKFPKPDSSKTTQSLGSIARLTCSIITSSFFTGYLVGTLAGDSKDEMNFLELFAQCFRDFLKEKGFNLGEIKLHQIRIRKTSFSSWTTAKTSTKQFGLYGNHEIGLAIFEVPSGTFDLVGPIEKGMAPFDVTKIEIDSPSPVNLHLYSETLARYTAILKKGQTVTTEDRSKLAEKQISYLYVHQDEISDLQSHRLQSLIDENIEDFNSEARAKDLANKNRMEQELETAKTVQDALFPKSTYEDDFVKIKGHYRTSSECGGDWWYYSIVGDKVYLFIGDATGHGVPAALVCSAAKASVSLLVHFPNLTLDGLMSILNHAIYGTTQGKILMTFCLACIDLRTSEITICNASHEAPLVFPLKTNLKKSDITALTATPGSRLGEGLKSPYTVEKWKIDLADRLFFYTDGVTELENEKGEQWNEQRMTRSLLNGFQKGPGIEAAYAALNSDIESFRNGTPFVDDVTYFMVEFKKIKN